MRASNQNHATPILMRIRREIAADSLLLADRLQPESDLQPGAGFSDLFAAASEANEAELYQVSLEYIFEGYLLHFGTSRLLTPAADDGFWLLAGDYMYARGLTHIARLDDPAPVRMLAALIGACARIQCEGLDPALALDAWSATTLCLAAHATVGVTESACLKHLEDYRKGEGQRLPDGVTPLATLLAAMPEATAAEMRAIIDNIYECFNPAISA